ncbi:hypothetical protein [Candidatus Poriferisodalis sp.]|uniref:hypothetical protein n=1 Tax=Candidatus Poriferisodalis sp. TaxID=3101277 RepID=UPI003B02DF10
MAATRTTTIRLSDEDRALLAQLAVDYGDQSRVIRHGIRLLAQEQRRRQALAQLVDEWEAVAGPVDEAEVSAMTERYFS